MYRSCDHGEIEVNSEGVPIEINPIRFWSDNAQKMPALSKLALSCSGLQCPCGKDIQSQGYHFSAISKKTL